MNYLAPALLRLLLLATLIGCKHPAQSQKPGTRSTTPPDSLYGTLFTEVQMQRIFADGKTFVDAIPRRPVADIMYDYGLQKGPGMDLRQFVLQNFTVPGLSEQPGLTAAQGPASPHQEQVGPAEQEPIALHIKNLWEQLTRQPDATIPGSSLLPLPHPYIVPGGRFREVYYWDSYFTMLGLKEDGRTDLIENMVQNFAYLIDTYGHIPNGNRTYYLSRSQPPFFVLMVELLASIKGPQILQTYLPQLEQEYAYWMQGDKQTKKGEATLRFVRMPDGEYLNRYFDEAATPRPESYREDVITADTAVLNEMMRIKFASKAAADAYAAQKRREIYMHLRAGAASGWDFSSRWFADGQSIHTIETANIVPVDLNCLILKLEQTLAKAYAGQRNTAKTRQYQTWAKERQQAIQKYFYNKATGYYYDYHFVQRRQLMAVTAAGLFPFFIMDAKQMSPLAAKAATVVRSQLLAPGGLLTTPVNSHQQWDAPNGWAPLQWVAVAGLSRCGQQALADTIAQRWITVTEGVYARTGKLMEKYNVVNTSLEAGGGEYPGQDGFGWTNGVYLALKARRW